MTKKITAIMLTILMIISIFSNVILAEEINSENNLDILSMDSSNNNLFEIQAIDSNGQPLADGHMQVYSYLEGKIVGQVNLDENGRALFKYQPSRILIEKDLKDKGVIDVQYSIFITNGKEVYLDGFTKTYYSPNFFQGKGSIEVATTIMTDKDQTLNVATRKIENVENLKVVDNDSTIGTYSVDPSDVIIESRSLGSKQTDFATINSAVGCKAGASIEKGTKTTISGSNILSASFTASTSLMVSQETTVSNNPYKYDFYTYYNYVEEKHLYKDLFTSYVYYVIRATDWNGGIGYYSYLENKNAVSPSSVSVLATYGPNSTARLSAGTSFTIGAAANFTGPLSGTKYSARLEHKTYSALGVWRIHGNTTYYEYGSGKPIVERYITRN